MSSHVTKLSRKPKRGRLPSFVEWISVIGAILLVVLIVVPTFASFRDAGRIADAKHDTHRTGEAMLAMLGDIQQNPYRIELSTSLKRYLTVDIFIGPGNMPATPRRDGDALQWVNGEPDLFNDQLIENTSAYEVRYETHTWRGPYITKPIPEDPWGNAYICNIKHLSLHEGSRDKDGRVKNAVYVLSAGPNGIIDTPYEQPITLADVVGDDIGYRIQ